MESLIILENEQTGTNHSFDTDSSHIPRIGERVTLWDAKADKTVLDGIVQSVTWSIGSLGYSVIIVVKPDDTC